MDNILWQKALELADRPYTLEVIADETTDDDSIFIARNPELEGCLGQGKSIEEAVSDLGEARIDFIYSLLEDNLPIPDPYPLATSTASVGSTIHLSNIGKNEEEVPSRLYEASLKPIYNPSPGSQ